MRHPSLAPIVPEMTQDFATHWDAQRRRIERRLDLLVPAAETPPPIIHQAMRYSLFAGGKRLRPILCLETSCLLAGDKPQNSDMEAIASTLELIHTYSLIHDDLPALDDDDLRRGRPTCHVQFDEATAILAGDALLTLAFQVLAQLPATPADVRSHLIAELATDAGTVDGMIGGQVVDLEAAKKAPDAETLDYIHRSKTAALIRAAVVMGALTERAAPADIDLLRRFGTSAGLAFQIIDDVLDVEGTSASLGKTAGKDQAQHKVTFPALYGVERSRQMAAERLGEAKAALDSFGARADALKQVADSLVFRST